MEQHSFTNTILEILARNFENNYLDVSQNSQLLQYINIKTRSADRGSKSRGSFANLYALYVLLEDYVAHGYVNRNDYSTYEGAIFSNLFRRQRELPFGSKLQNHALNHRLNEEFKKYFPLCEFAPIVRNPETNRYWINENLIKIPVGTKVLNLAPSIITIIDSYIETKKGAFQRFITACKELQSLSQDDPRAIANFVFDLLAPNVDARLFEIVSYAILKHHYRGQVIYFGFEVTNLQKENLKLFKTGRTNANDGGIDFVMKPLGRFFQVTETLDVGKYFLDIDKVERYPVTFVIKSEESVDQLKAKLRQDASKRYAVAAIVSKYMDCIEEIINLPILRQRFSDLTKEEYVSEVLEEIIRQSRVEFNYEDEEEEVEQTEP